MPIKINLLAEAQELERMRRRDPVKRLVLVGLVLVVLILAWSSSLMVKVMIKKGELTRIESEAKARENSYKQLLESQKSAVEGKLALAALDRLAGDRFLVGNLLNALQKDTLENVGVVRLKLDQNWVLIPEIKPEKGSKTVPKPATVKGNITILISARDKSPTPGDGVSKFQLQLSKDPYFENLLDQSGFQLTSLGASQLDATDGRPYLPMNVEGHLPEKIR